MDAKEEQKLKRLNAVFLKAVDMTTDSVSSGDIRACFDSSVSGNSLSTVESVFVNSLGRMKQNIEVSVAAFPSLL